MDSQIKSTSNFFIRCLQFIADGNENTRLRSDLLWGGLGHQYQCLPNAYSSDTSDVGSFVITHQPFWNREGVGRNKDDYALPYVDHNVLLMVVLLKIGHMSEVVCGCKLLGLGGDQ